MEVWILLRWYKCFKTDLLWWLYNLVSLLKIIELYIWSRWIICYVKYASIKLLKKKKEQGLLNLWNLELQGQEVQNSSSESEALLLPLIVSQIHVFYWLDQQRIMGFDLECILCLKAFQNHQTVSPSWCLNCASNKLLHIPLGY